MNDTSTSRTRGAAAFAAGLSRVPAFDAEFMQSFRDSAVGGSFSAHAAAWLKGWDEANLADEAKR